MDMSINQRLAEFFHQKKIRQEELRIKLGINSRQQVNNWLHCVSSIPAKHLLEIFCQFPDLNANWVLHNIGNPFIDQKSLRQINRNQYGFCEECIEKNKEIQVLKQLLAEKTEESNKYNREIGKLEEQNNRLKKLLEQAGIRPEN